MKLYESVMCNKFSDKPNLRFLTESKLKGIEMLCIRTESRNRL